MEKERLSTSSAIKAERERSERVEDLSQGRLMDSSWLLFRDLTFLQFGSERDSREVESYVNALQELGRKEEELEKQGLDAAERMLK